MGGQKYKKFPMTEKLDERLKNEVRESGISGNAIVVIALDEYLKKRERERKNNENV